MIISKYSIHNYVNNFYKSFSLIFPRKYIKCKVRKVILILFFSFISETVHVMCHTQCIDKEIVEVASTWFAQASTRFKRALEKRQRGQIIVETNLPAYTEQDNDDT